LRGPQQSPFEGGVFHIALQFPDTYPDEAPVITLFNSIPHPFVSGDRICLNMLDSERSGPYTGWSPAYSVQSILLQLQSFLLDGLEASTIRPGYNVTFSQK
jgi:ubiquitin-conjugating enzyme E2 N